MTATLRARIDLKALLAETSHLLQGFRTHLTHLRALHDEEDGAQPDADKYADVTESLNDLGPLCTELIPEERADFLSTATAADEKEKRELEKWKRESPVQALVDLASQIGGKARYPIDEAVMWRKSQPDAVSLLQDAQLDFV